MTTTLYFGQVVQDGEMFDTVCTVVPQVPSYLVGRPCAREDAPTVCDLCRL